jgi:hypothetical protein
MSRLGDFGRAVWEALDTGKLPDAPAVSTREDIDSPCVLCHGVGTLHVEGTNVACPAPKCAGKKTKELPR